MLFALLFICTFANTAFAGNDVTFFVNMNYSKDELKTLKKIAADRGQEFVVVPPENSNESAAAFESARTALEKKIKEIHPDWDTIKQLGALLEIQRQGAGYSGDAEIAAGASAEMEKLFEEYNKVEQMESQLGTIDEQIRNKLKQLKAEGKNIDKLVISAHSDGTNLSGETGYNMNGSEVYQLSKDFPAMFKQPRHVLLMGCYTMTKSNRNFWRGSMFPHASMIVGFSPRAPARTDPNNLKLMRDVIATADKLDAKMAEDGKAVTKEEVANLFLALKSVTETRYNPVIDYCTYQFEGKPEMQLSCTEQWDLLLDQAQSVQEVYLNLSYPQKDPPRETSYSDLRRFYNDLQEICPASELSDISEEEKSARSTYVDSMILMTRNLIFWWNVQANFSFCKKSEISALQESLANSGIEGSIPPLDGNTSWVEFVQAMNQIKESLRTQRKDLRTERQKLSVIPYGISASEKEEMLNRRKEVNEQLNAVDNATEQFGIMDDLYELNEQIPLSWHNSGTSPSRCGGNE